MMRYRVTGRHGDNKQVYFHQLVCACREGESVDHINGDTLDNRVENLRSATATTQVINKKDSTRELPPGIKWDKQYKDYIVTWQELERPLSHSFSIYYLGERGALMAALSMRMDKLISIDSYITALFPIDRINTALASEGTDVLPHNAPIAHIRNALRFLYIRKYNLWTIPYDGTFARYGEKADWKPDDTKCRIAGLVSKAYKRTIASVSEKSLRSELDRLEDCVRKALTAYVNTLPAGSAKIEMETMHDISEGPTVEEAREEARKHKYKPSTEKDIASLASIITEKVAKEETVCTTTKVVEGIEASAKIDQVKTIKAIENMNRALAKIQEPPPPAKEVVPRKYAPCPSFDAWYNAKVSISEGSAIRLSDGYRMYTEWCERAWGKKGRGQCAGIVKFGGIMSDHGVVRCTDTTLWGIRISK